MFHPLTHGWEIFLQLLLNQFLSRPPVPDILPPKILPPPPSKPPLVLKPLGRASGSRHVHPYRKHIGRNHSHRFYLIHHLLKLSPQTALNLSKPPRKTVLILTIRLPKCRLVQLKNLLIQLRLQILYHIIGTFTLRTRTHRHLPSLTLQYRFPVCNLQAYSIRPAYSKMDNQYPPHSQIIPYLVFLVNSP